MKRIAFLISSDMRRDAANPRPDIHELDAQMAALAPACRDVGLALELNVWNAADVDWGEFDAAVIGPTWDYWDQADTFLSTLERIEARTPLFNSSRLVRWNIEKTYLRDLEAGGAPTIPTLWAPRATPEAAADAFTAFETDTLVIKPQVGASAWRLVRLKKGEPWPDAAALPTGAALIQPFLPGIAEVGEVSLMTYGGQVSHGVRKVPKGGDFRVQSLFGGREVAHDVTDVERDVAMLALGAVDEPLLYARIDLAPGLDGAPTVIELEAIEPYHYPEHGPKCGAMFAAALAQALADRS